MTSEAIEVAEVMEAAVLNPPTLSETGTVGKMNTDKIIQLRIYRGHLRPLEATRGHLRPLKAALENRRFFQLIRFIFDHRDPIYRT